MRWSVAVVALLCSACNCGFEPVEECERYDCSGLVEHDGGRADAGAPPRPDAGAPDAGALDAGLDAGSPDASVLDASVPEDAGLDDAGVEDAGRADSGVNAPDAGSVDSGLPGDAGCLDILRSTMTRAGDWVAVTGVAGAYGAVDYVIGGYSAGAAGATGIQRFTNAQYLNQGLPNGAFDTGLWMWTANDEPVTTSTRYVGTNTSLLNRTAPLINFRIAPQVSCAAGAGQGWFQFETFQVTALNMLVEGDFEFDCASANISVRGCFHYAR